MTIAEARSLLTPDVREALASLGRDAYTIDYMQAIGVPMPLIRAMLVGPLAPAENARVAPKSRKREMTTAYVWGPDIAGFLKGWE